MSWFTFWHNTSHKVLEQCGDMPSVVREYELKTPAVYRLSLIRWLSNVAHYPIKKKTAWKEPVDLRKMSRLWMAFELKSIIVLMIQV